MKMTRALPPAGAVVQDYLVWYYGGMEGSFPSNAEKAALWRGYSEGRSSRVPVRLNVNPRVVLQDPGLNEGGWTFESAAGDPEIHVEVSLRWQRYVRTVLNRWTDAPYGAPEVWEVGLQVYNVHEAAFFGAEVRWTAGQVPATEPILDEGNRREVLKLDVEHPLERGYYRKMLDFWEEMALVCKGKRFEGRPVRLMPWAVGTDGPVTVACNLRGVDFLTEIIEEPEWADELMGLITRQAIVRRRAWWEYWGDRLVRGNGQADDSCAMLSPGMYRERVLPLHRRYYESAPREMGRGMHLCGNASHLFPIMVEELGVRSFDTGFPVDHGKVRREVGPEVEIYGGVETALLLNGTAEQVYGRAKEILLSGVKEGGRFVLQEANNLPPGVPLGNLEAMYRACLEYGDMNH
jgi:uroporphyrinogen-III decarboxylase